MGSGRVVKSSREGNYSNDQKGAPVLKERVTRATKYGSRSKRVAYNKILKNQPRKGVDFCFA